MVALSVDAPEDAAKMRQATKAGFDFLSDPAGSMLDMFGVRHVGGFGGEDIAQSASFLLDRRGTVVWRRIAENYRVRPRPDEILAAADLALGGEP